MHGPGATVSLVHAKITEIFKDNPNTIDFVVESTMSTPYKYLGKLKLNLDVDGILKDLNITAIEIMAMVYEVIARNLQVEV